MIRANGVAVTGTTVYGQSPISLVSAGDETDLVEEVSLAYWNSPIQISTL
jgi:hypothetical protein